MKNRYYIRATGPFPDTHYWMDGPKHWTTSPFSASLYDSEQSALNEVQRAGIANECEVCLQRLPAAKVVQRDGPATRLRKANERASK